MEVEAQVEVEVRAQVEVKAHQLVLHDALDGFDDEVVHLELPLLLVELELLGDACVCVGEDRLEVLAHDVVRLRLVLAVLDVQRAQTQLLHRTAHQQ